LFTDYTFAVWAGTPGSSELVPVTKAYSGLTDEEFAKVDAFIKRNTIGRQGGFRAVKPELVFEIAFEGIAESDRHKSGIALRFPRMHRWRTDKKPIDADTLESLQALLKVHQNP
jgi:DNA ligase-1